MTYTEDMLEEVNAFMSQVVPEIRLAVQGDGHYLNVVNFPHNNNLQVLQAPDNLIILWCDVLVILYLQAEILV